MPVPANDNISKTNQLQMLTNVKSVEHFRGTLKTSSNVDKYSSSTIFIVYVV